ncbi:MAG: hypothetical protein KDB27_36035 [Planctomycetales bacterium]|nr:hypothetical protein [Planctomycetales bacterium]
MDRIDALTDAKLDDSWVLATKAVFCAQANPTAEFVLRQNEIDEFVEELSSPDSQRRRYASLAIARHRPDSPELLAYLKARLNSKTPLGYWEVRPLEIIGSNARVLSDELVGYAEQVVLAEFDNGFGVLQTATITSMNVIISALGATCSQEAVPVLLQLVESATKLRLKVVASAAERAITEIQSANGNLKD